MNTIPSTGRCKLRLDYHPVLLAAVIAVFALCSRTCALTINPTFDSSIENDPEAAAIKATIKTAIAWYGDRFLDPITVSIRFVKDLNISLGQSNKQLYSISYSDYRAALASHATSQDDATAVAGLPIGSNNPVNSNKNVYLTGPLARALGFAAKYSTPDGTIRLNTSKMNLSDAQADPNKFPLFAVVSHEIDEVLGSGSALNNLKNGDAAPTGPILPEDLFRYDQNGMRNFTTDSKATSFFSLDGKTNLARFNQKASGDFSDWFSPGGQTPLVQDAFGTPGSDPVLDVELRMLDVLGYNCVSWQVLVDFAYKGSPNLGTYKNPYRTLATAVSHVPRNGIVLLRGPHSSPEKISISKAMTLKSVGGPATIGQ